MKFSLPGIYYSAEEGSKSGQESYFKITKIRLIFLVVAALSSLGAAATVQTEAIFTTLAFISLISFVAALSAELVLRTGSPENGWYHGRALAESIKTLAWRYATKSGDYHREESEQQTEERFISTVKRIAQESPALANLPVSTKPIITREMRMVRRKGFKDRLDFYLAQRLEDQISWYSKRAQQSKRKENVLRLLLIILEIAGIAASTLLLLRISLLDFGATISALIAALVAWLAAKQYEHLSNAYSLTAMELSLVKEDARLVIDDETLSSFVINAEQAMSREHTMWIARRVKPGM